MVIYGGIKRDTKEKKYYDLIEIERDCVKSRHNYYAFTDKVHKNC